MKVIKAIFMCMLCLALGVSVAAAEEPAVEKLSGIDMILISASDLEDSLNFFVNHMELNIIARGKLDRKLMVEADCFAPRAARMLLMTGGRAISYPD